MAVLDAYLCEDTDSGSTNGNLSLGLHDFETDHTAWWPTRDSIVTHEDERSSHAIVSNLPVSQAPRVLLAEVPITYFDDYYNRVHIIPSAIALGNLVSEQIRYFDVWNAYFVPRTLNAIVETDTDGLTLTEPSPTPMVYAGFQMAEYQLTVSPDGPPSIAALYTFEFDDHDYPVTVTGQRVILFHFEPNGPVIEELQWATDISTAYDGTEQRAGIRGAPRQRLDYEVLTDGVEETKLQGLLFAWLPLVFGVPIWFEQRRVTAAVPAGSLVINVSTAYGDFREDGLVMIYQDENTHEVMGISSFDATSITLEAELLHSYTRKAVVMPVRVAYATTQVNRNVYPTGVARTKVSFTTIENENLASSAGSTLYEGKVLLSDANFMGETLNEAFEGQVVVVDSMSGRLYQKSGWDHSKYVSRKQWRVQHNMAEVWRIRQLLHSFDGSRVSFWLPSFRPDLQVTETIAGNTPTIRVALCNYTQFFSGRLPFGNIRVVLNSGVTYNREITASVVDGDDEVLTIDSALSVSDITIAEVDRIEFIGLMRIANDKAKLTHYRAGTAQVEIQVSSVKLPSA